MTRVVVDENATQEQILEATKNKFNEKINTEIGEHLEEIVDDEEMPFGKGLGENMVSLKGGELITPINDLKCKSNCWNMPEGIIIHKGAKIRVPNSRYAIGIQ